MVRAAARKSKKKYVELSDESNDEGQTIDDEVLGSQKGDASAPKRRNNNDSFENGSSKKKGLSGKVVYKGDGEEDFTDAGEMDDEGDSNFDKQKTQSKRKSVARKGKKGKKGAKKGKSTGGKKSKKPKYASSSEEVSEEEEEPESDS